MRYDDFVDGVFFAYGSPYARRSGRIAAGAACAAGHHRLDIAGIPASLRRSHSSACACTVEQVCNPAGALTAWPFRQIEGAVRPTADQQKLLDDLKAAASQAADTFKSSCRTDFAMTPTGRLEAMSVAA